MISHQIKTSNSKVLSSREKNTINGKSKSFFMIYPAPTLLIEGMSNVWQQYDTDTCDNYTLSL